MAFAESGIKSRWPFEKCVIAPSALNVTVMMPFDTVSESSSVETDTGATSAGSVAVGRAAPNDSASTHIGVASISTTERSTTGAGLRI